jgi:hypothetical protein
VPGHRGAAARLLGAGRRCRRRRWCLAVEVVPAVAAVVEAAAAGSGADASGLRGKERCSGSLLLCSVVCGERRVTWRPVQCEDPLIGKLQLPAGRTTSAAARGAWRSQTWSNRSPGVHSRAANGAYPRFPACHKPFRALYSRGARSIPPLSAGAPSRGSHS